MDWCRDYIGLGHLGRYAERVADDAIISRLESLYHENLLFHSKQLIMPIIMKPLDAPAFSNLTRDYCREFNRFTPDDPSVYYCSYAAKTELRPYQALAFSHSVVTEKEGPNDGLVSVASAKYGDFLGVVECDHWDLVPSKVRAIAEGLKKKPVFDHVEFYLSIANRLGKMGF
jgi:hypothetical protein